MSGALVVVEIEIAPADSGGQKRAASGRRPRDNTSSDIRPLRSPGVGNRLVVPVGQVQGAEAEPLFDPPIVIVVPADIEAAVKTRQLIEMAGNQRPAVGRAGERADRKGLATPTSALQRQADAAIFLVVGSPRRSKGSFLAASSATQFQTRRGCQAGTISSCAGDGSESDNGPCPGDSGCNTADIPCSSSSAVTSGTTDCDCSSA